MRRVATVEAFLADGCGRCADYKTPACKVHRWRAELVALRDIVRATGLVEEVKWGFPCYVLEGKNVVMIGAFKEFCALQFFKGVMLDDAEQHLEAPGPNSRHGRYWKFRSVVEIDEQRPAIQGLLTQAIALERAGVKVATSRAPIPVPVELERRLSVDVALARAYEALTPGRKRSHILHISGAKQATTRERRVDACVPKILVGRGFNER